MSYVNPLRFDVDAVVITAIDEDEVKVKVIKRKDVA